MVLLCRCCPSIKKVMSKMLNKLFPSVALKTILAFFVVGVIWWVALFVFGLKFTGWNYGFQLFALGIIVILSGIIPLLQQRKISFLEFDTVQKSRFWIGLGLVMWGMGTIVFTYYNIFVATEAPYPSLSDVFFLSASFMWIIGLVYLCCTNNLQQQFKHLLRKVAFFLIPIGVVILFFFLLFAMPSFSVTSFTGIKIIFDIFYPLSDVFMMSVLFFVLYCLLTKKIQALYLMPTIILSLGIIAIYAADLSFSSVTTQQTYFVGHYVDFFFAVAMFLLGWGVNVIPNASSATVADTK